MTSTGQKQSGFPWTPVLAGLLAFSVVAIIYFAGRVNETQRELARLRSTAREQNMEVTRLTEVVTFLSSADTTVIMFGEGKAAAAHGKILVNPSRGVLLLASNLPPAPAGKAYEMWIIRNGKPLPAGTFQSGSDGSATHIQRARIEPGSESVAVTLEDAAGAPAPTSTPLFSAPLRGQF